MNIPHSRAVLDWVPPEADSETTVQLQVALFFAFLFCFVLCFCSEKLPRKHCWRFLSVRKKGQDNGIHRSRAQHFSLDQWFSNFSLPQNHWEAANTQISNKCLWDVLVAVPGASLCETLVMLLSHDSYKEEMGKYSNNLLTSHFVQLSCFNYPGIFSLLNIYWAVTV